jgi:hypothetical protein
MITLGDDPTLSLHVGDLYRFRTANFGFHKLSLRNQDLTIYTGVTGFPLTAMQSVDFILPADAPSTLIYVCDYHAGMSGQITVIP